MLNYWELICIYPPANDIINIIIDDNKSANDLDPMTQASKIPIELSYGMKYPKCHLLSIEYHPQDG